MIYDLENPYPAYLSKIRCVPPDTGFREIVFFEKL